MEITYNLTEIEEVAKKVISNSKTKTILFYGEMGVGKTTLIKKIVESLGSEDEVSSPTFSIVNEYNLKEGKLYHFDLYRLKSTEEAYDFGIEDYLDSDHWKLIEWPEKVDASLFDTFDEVHITSDGSNSRILKLN
ncbi:tRNA (adenosine(37)-N6)-threonylcarbamoyltransferase complex ATPase subunit type 1 TsaE [Tamlana sp. 2_MG-2023]|uniref:tRNA (adenosine(37)-N6)-threonylcarbamoyltransferase complex ATPase subunit type 1 TsaE n=1 Tax=unclassified Tamlana TaxID=2614803 RepID=UPI0026E345BC|nr:MULTISPECIES: tRNA (adenosine(37)-N6)-threonylcarbamoyltransferase complex ATPase subunit type 1 TsaE [unclassified Tamlana]MDO6759433.1 tRNA (adenosine(37)-N6)-threonylcarbamoyltransferase complex ATPase subunit type 1 TsaE [Tamlana sp. 2_MG-2023]MDO6790428.1 tRNA (adenosine(37)-N6)-threonylcarbamoyltransferase complex ATPase subunit type 1 TsaE [Tamlana sp. 1_MG-2023]